MSDSQQEVRESLFFQNQIVAGIFNCIDIEQIQDNLPLLNTSIEDQNYDDFYQQVDYFLIAASEKEKETLALKDKCKQIILILKSMLIIQHIDLQKINEDGVIFSYQIAKNQENNSIGSDQKSFELIILEYSQPMALIFSHKFAIKVSKSEIMIKIHAEQMEKVGRLEHILSDLMNFAKKMQYESLQLHSILTNNKDFINIQTSLKQKKISLQLRIGQESIENENIVQLIKQNIYQQIFFSLTSSISLTALKIQLNKELKQFQKVPISKLNGIPINILLNSTRRMHKRYDICIKFEGEYFTFVKSSISRYSKSIVSMISYCLQMRSDAVTQIQSALIRIIMTGDPQKLIDEFQKIAKRIN